MELYIGKVLLNEEWDNKIKERSGTIDLTIVSPYNYFKNGEFVDDVLEITKYTSYTDKETIYKK